MVTQNWVSQAGKRRFSMSYCPEQTPHTTVGALLLPGFLEPMCDTDYFMSKLAKKLYHSGIYVLQMDLYGSGDSAGESEEITLDGLRDDILSGIAQLKRIGMEKIFCVGRGIIATLLSEEPVSSLSSGVFGINPYCVSPDVVSKMWPGLQGDCIDLHTVFQGTEYTDLSDFDDDNVSFFSALGAHIRNIHGQMISTAFLNELCTYSGLDAVGHCKNAYFIVNNPNSEKGYMVCNHLDKTRHRDLHTYYRCSLMRDAMWQYNVIIEIKRRILAEVPNDADTHSN